MNILAHLHLATLANSSLIGNSVADFVKGDPYLVYPSDIADGIMTHRRIDAMIDNLAEVKYAKSLFRKTHQRVASITLDIVWDHFLSKYWHDYCATASVAEFNDLVQERIQPCIHHYPSDYQHFMNAMWRGKWLENYAKIDFIDDVLSGMANRRPKLFKLKETSIDIRENYTELQTCFIKLYPKMSLSIRSNAYHVPRRKL